MKLRTILLASLLAAAAVRAAADERIAFRPAHWVRGAALEPGGGDFAFAAMAFSSSNEGWIVGRRYMLHLRGDGGLEVAFLRAHDHLLSIDSIGFAGTGEGWAGVSAPSADRPWPLLRFRDGEWQGEQLPGIAASSWRIHAIIVGHQAQAWAAARDSRTKAQLILRHDGGHWAVDEVLSGHLGAARLLDGCQAVDGSWWFVGAERVADSPRRLLLANWDGRALRHADLPDLPVGRSHLRRVSCLSDGSIWAMGAVRRQAGGTGETLLLRFDGAWQRVSLPPADPRLEASAFAAITANDLWLAAACVGGVECRPRFLRWTGASWDQFEIAPLPDGRSTGFSINDVHFVSPDEGWAIGNDYEGPGLVRGLIFHYRDGTWYPEHLSRLPLCTRRNLLSSPKHQ